VSGKVVEGVHGPNEAMTLGHCRENIKLFRGACRKAGIAADDLMTSSQLFEVKSHD
jgi:hypothetical protein